MSEFLTKIKYDPSPHKSKRVAPITHIVIHAMDGTFIGSQAWFKNKSSKVSAHFLVGKKGELLQMVSIPNAAWHVKNFNSHAIGIELEDLDPKTRKTCKTDPNWCTPIELETAAHLTAELMRDYKIPMANVIGHNDPMLKKLGNTHTDPDKYFPWAKFRDLVKTYLDKDEKGEKA